MFVGGKNLQADTNQSSNLQQNKALTVRTDEVRLAEFFRLMSHPDRIRMVEALSTSSKDVSALADSLLLDRSRISQHLRLMRAYGIVVKRSEGRHRIYQLVQPELTKWMRDAPRNFRDNT